MILSIKYFSLNLLFKQVITQHKTCQGFSPFIVTKYYDFLHFQRQYHRSCLCGKYYIDSIYDYPETSMAHTILLTETQPSNTLSTNIYFSEFPLLETTPTTHDKTTNPNNAAAVSWATISHQQPTMDPTIYALTIE